ncbi:MAG: hypothetical protein AB7T63_14365 [Planctomycetota bacterium]
MNTRGGIPGPQTTRHPRRSWPGLAAACVLAAGLLGCSSDFTVERRESPVHVWLSVPGRAVAGGQVHAEVSLGPYGVVRDVVSFPRGVPTVELPTVYVRDGAYIAAVRLRELGVAVQQAIEVEGETWVTITVDGRSVRIATEETQPDPSGR